MPTDIEFNPHSLLKIEILKSHGINMSKEIVEDVIRNPDRIDVGYKKRLIAQKGFDEIQFDYVRFPNDGDKKKMNFNDNNVKKYEAIKLFGRAQENLMMDEYREEFVSSLAHL